MSTHIGLCTFCLALKNFYKDRNKQRKHIKNFFFLKTEKEREPVNCLTFYYAGFMYLFVTPSIFSQRETHNKPCHMGGGHRDLLTWIYGGKDQQQQKQCLKSGAVVSWRDHSYGNTTPHMKRTADTQVWVCVYSS